MIRINRGDLGLNDLVGLGLVFTDGHDLPLDIYVYGLQDRDDDIAIYLDRQLNYAQEVSKFLNDSGWRTKVGLPTNPRERPGVGIVRSFREQTHIQATTKAVVYILFAHNGRVRFEHPAFEFQAGDVIIYRGQSFSFFRYSAPIGRERLAQAYPIVLVEGLARRADEAVAINSDHAVPKPPVVGDRIRILTDNPTYDHGSRVLYEITAGAQGVVYDTYNDDTVHIHFDNQQRYYVDADQVRVTS